MSHTDHTSRVATLAEDRVIAQIGFSASMIDLLTPTLAQCEADVVAELGALSVRSRSARLAAAGLAIDRYVDALRDAEFAPERVVIAIKGTTRRAAVLIHASSATWQIGPDWDAIRDEVVTRAIRRFFQPRVLQP